MMHGTMSLKKKKTLNGSDDHVFALQIIWFLEFVCQLVFWKGHSYIIFTSQIHIKSFGIV